jgi:indole-3-acetate monooxygenase
MHITIKRQAQSSAASERMLAKIDELASAIAARAAEIEAARRIPPDLVETLRSIGVFRMFVPRSHGGLELDLPQGVQIITALSRIDSSVGWNAMAGSSSALFAAMLPLHVYNDVYRNGPNVIFAGSGQPSGTAEMIDGEWHVSGRWPFASGCQSAGWMLGLCILKEDGRPLPGAAEGMPLVKAAVMPASTWTIEDTWHTAGLRGTGSHHIILDDVIVPNDHFIDFIGGAPCVPGALYQALQQIVVVIHGAVEVGIAEGAVQDIVALADTGRQQQRASVPMQQSELFRFELGRIEAELRAAKAMYAAQVASHWQHAIDRTLRTNALLIQTLQTVVWIATTCTRIAESCYALGGGKALHNSSPLQRRMRDMRTASQHMLPQPRHYASAGELLLGHPV